MSVAVLKCSQRMSFPPSSSVVDVMEGMVEMVKAGIAVGGVEVGIVIEGVVVGLAEEGVVMGIAVRGQVEGMTVESGVVGMVVVAMLKLSSS